ncbi:MAG: peptidylprolyl isomerase [Saprospiraceae bacterium]|nr:MAG: peptidylprolyl isomerase [Saprospiraceae bacterium]
MLNKLVLSFAVTFVASMGFAQKEVIDKVIAHVGGEIVLLSELEEQYAALSEKNAKLPPNTRCLILDNMLTAKLLINQARLDSIKVTEAEVEDQLNARIDQILEYMGGDISQFEDYYGQTISEVKASFREDLSNQLLSERMSKQVMENISVTPSEVKAFFKRIPLDSLPYFNSEVEVGELVYKPQINEEERQKAINKLENIRKQIVDGGQDFAELAKTYSDDFASARIGGDLGWTKRGKFVPEFEAAAYNLDEGEISGIVESPFGFHLIQLISRRGNTINTRHILVKPEITDADMDMAKAKMDSIRLLLLSDSMTFATAVKKFGLDEVQSFNNSGKMINPHTGNTFFEIADLEPDIFFTIDTMEVGGYSNPFTFTDQRGETFFRLVQLQSRSEPHIASLKTDYSKIQTAAIEEKKSSYLTNWISQKVDATYVKIDPWYADCPILAKWQKDVEKP